MKELFRRFASSISTLAGSAWAFTLAIFIVVVWALTGPVFNFSNTWQLFINSLTTIVTFIMVFLIQNTQNRTSKATQLKLDELIRATRARDSFIDLEDMQDDELAYIAEQFRTMHEKSSDPIAKKFHGKLQHAITRRSRLPGEDFVNRLNPFNSHEDLHKPKK